MRISAMVDPSGVVKAIEVIARDEELARGSDRHAGWQPFVYEKRWGRWFPSSNARNMKIENFCIRCHQSDDGRFSPFANNIADGMTLRKIGYLNEEIIEGQLEYK